MEREKMIEETERLEEDIIRIVAEFRLLTGCRGSLKRSTEIGDQFGGSKKLTFEIVIEF